MSDFKTWTDEQLAKAKEVYRAEKKSAWLANDTTSHKLASDHYKAVTAEIKRRTEKWYYQKLWEMFH